MSDARNVKDAIKHTLPFSLAEIVKATNGKIILRDTLYLRGEPVPPEKFEPWMIAAWGVCTDTRSITMNSVFVALRGKNFDGHNFLAQAKNAGAVVAVVEDISKSPNDLVCVQVENTLLALGDLARFHRNRFRIPVVGVTGSYGKTTTRAFLQATLSPPGRVLASRENFNNEIGVPQTLFGLNAGHRAAIVEMGMRGEGQIEYLADVARPTIGVITNIGPQHIELLGSLENIARAKAELIQKLPSDGVAILPSEGDYSELLLEIAQEVGCRIVTFGKSENADVQVASTRTNNESVEVEFKIQNSEFKTLLPLSGVHNATNAAASLAVAHVLGVDLKDAARALENVDVPDARMKVRRVGEITILDDCYNAGPNSMRAALDTLRDWKGAKRHVAVLGAMKELGEWSDDEHRKLGELASLICDVVIYVGEEARAAFDVTPSDVTPSDVTPSEKWWCADANEAAHRVLERVQNGDVVLVKGSRSVGLETVVQKLVDA